MSVVIFILEHFFIAWVCSFFAVDQKINEKPASPARRESPLVSGLLRVENAISQCSITKDLRTFNAFKFFRGTTLYQGLI